MRLLPMTYNILFVVYYLASIINIHTLVKTKRNKFICFIVWLMIGVISVVSSYLANLYFNDVNTEVMLLSTSLLSLLAYFYLFPENGHLLNIYYYFMINNILALYVLISRSVGACFEYYSEALCNMATLVIFIVLIAFYLNFYITRLCHVIPSVIKNLKENIKSLACFSALSYIGVHFIVDIWGAWPMMTLRLFISRVSSVVLPFSAFIFLFLSIKRLSEKETYEREMITDHLTQIGNRRKLMNDIVEQVENNSKEKGFLIYFDLDSFKNVNDNYGHDVGDAYLIGFTRMLSRYFCESEIYRLGGDEFVALMLHPKESKEEVVCHIEALLQSDFDNKSLPGFMGASYGIVEIYDFKNMSDYLSKADQRMYEQKAQHHRNDGYVLVK